MSDIDKALKSVKSVIIPNKEEFLKLFTTECESFFNQLDYFIYVDMGYISGFNSLEDIQNEVLHSLSELNDNPRLLSQIVEEFTERAPYTFTYDVITAALVVYDLDHYTGARILTALIYLLAVNNYRIRIVQDLKALLKKYRYKLFRSYKEFLDMSILTLDYIDIEEKEFVTENEAPTSTDIFTAFLESIYEHNGMSSIAEMLEQLIPNCTAAELSKGVGNAIIKAYNEQE